MKVAAVLSVLAVAGAPVTAQDLVYSDDATLDCINRASDTADMRACIGASAGACQTATPGGGTTVGMANCLNQELGFWDGVLNQNYQYVLGMARQTDAEMRNIGSSVTNLEQSLRAAQRAWIPFRDSTCAFERAQWGGGTGGGPASIMCLMRMTGEQALYLRDAWIGE